MDFTNSVALSAVSFVSMFSLSYNDIMISAIRLAAEDAIAMKSNLYSSMESLC